MSKLVKGRDIFFHEYGLLLNSGTIPAYTVRLQHCEDSSDIYYNIYEFLSSITYMTN